MDSMATTASCRKNVQDLPPPEHCCLVAQAGPDGAYCKQLQAPTLFCMSYCPHLSSQDEGWWEGRQVFSIYGRKKLVMEISACAAGILFDEPLHISAAA